MPQCNKSDVEPLLPLAGYVPENDIRRFAKVDRDLRQIDILLGWDNIDAARDLYRYGCNMVIDDSIPTSLRSVARKVKSCQSRDETRLYIMFEKKTMRTTQHMQTNLCGMHLKVLPQRYK